MFFALLTCCLCVDDYYECFGTNEECKDYITLLRSRNEFTINDISQINLLSTMKPSGIFIIASSQDVSITLDYTNTDLQSIDLQILGKSKKATLTIKLPNSIHIRSIVANQINVALEFESKVAIDIEKIKIFESNFNSNVDINANSVVFDSYSTLLSQFKFTVNYDLSIDTGVNINRFTIEPLTIIMKSFPSKAASVKVSTTTLTFYDQKKNQLSSILIDENAKYSSYLKIFDHEEKIVDVYVENPATDISSYKKIYFGYYVQNLRFTGTFPGDISTEKYIFYLGDQNEIIINSTYVPICLKSNSVLYLEVENYTLTVMQQDFSGYFLIYLISGKEFEDKRITIHLNSNNDYSIAPNSPNIDLVFNTYETNTNGNYFRACYNEKDINTYTFLNSVSNDVFIIELNDKLPAYFNDSSLKYYDQPVEFIKCNSGSFIIGCNILPGAHNLKQIFQFNSQISSDVTIGTLTKIENVTDFVPNIDICDSYCTFSDYLWIKPNNYSLIYDYLKPSYQMTIAFESLDVFPSTGLNFSKFPEGDSFSELILLSTISKSNILVTGSLKIHNLKLFDINLESTGSVQYDLVELIFESNGNIFIGNVVCNENVIITVPAASLNNVPLRYENIIISVDQSNTLKVSANSVRIVNNNVGLDLDLLTKKYLYLKLMNDEIILSKEVTDPITKWNFDKIAVKVTYSNLYMTFEGNWANCFVDFVDFSYITGEIMITQHRDAKDKIFPYLDTKYLQVQYSFNERPTDKEICLIPAGSSYNCPSGFSYNYEDGLNYLKTIHGDNLIIHVYPSNQPIAFAAEHLVYGKITIDSGTSATKSKIKLPNFMPKSDLTLSNVDLVIDTTEKFLIQGRHLNVDISKSDNAGPCFYFLSDFNKTLYQMFNVEKHSLFYEDFTGGLADLLFSIYNPGAPVQDVHITEKENIIFYMEKDDYYYCLKSNPEIKMIYLFNTGDGGNVINVYLPENIEVEAYSNDVQLYFDLYLHQKPSKITFHGTFKSVDLLNADEATEIRINDTSGAYWDFFTCRQSLHIDSPSFFIRNLFFRNENKNEENFSIIATPENCNVKINDILAFSDKKLVISSNIFLEINLLSAQNFVDYPFIHQINERNVARIVINSIDQFYPLVFNESTVVNLCPTFSVPQVTDDILSSLRNPINILTAKNMLSTYSDKYMFLKSSVFGFTDSTSIISISHDSSTIKFVVDKELSSLAGNVCYPGSSGEKCPSGYFEVTDLTVGKITEAAGLTPMINILILDTDVTINLDFGVADKNINFIFENETKCQAKIEKLTGILGFSFTNFDLSADIDFNHNIQSKYINCSLKTKENQNWGAVECDIFSLLNMENSYNIEYLKIDKDTIIDDFACFKECLIINENRINLPSLKQLTLDQKSLVNEQKLTIYDNTNLVVNLQSDFTLKISGSITSGSNIDVTGKGILTINVIPSTQDITAVQGDRIIKNNVAQVTKTFCVGGPCPAESETVLANEIGNRIQNDVKSDIIEVLISTNDELELTNSHLLGKDVRIKSTDSTQRKVMIESDKNSNLIILSAENLFINVTNPENELFFYQLALRKSFVNVHSDQLIEIRFVKSLSFDMYYMTNSDCPAIRDNTDIKYSPVNGGSTESINAIVSLGEFEDSFLILEDTQVKIVTRSGFTGYFLDDKNNLPLIEVKYMKEPSKPLIFKSDSSNKLDLSLNPNFGELRILIGFQLTDTSDDTHFMLEINGNINGLILCMSKTDIKVKDGFSINGKVSISDDINFIQLSEATSISFNEFEVNGSSFITLPKEIDSVSIKKLVINSIRSSFPFIYTLYGKCATVTINEMNSNTAAIISLVANTFNDVSGLLSSDSPIINIKQQRAADYSITWVNTDDHKHGMWNGNSIFTVKTEGETISLHPLYDSLEKLPAEICISDSPCSSKKAVQVLSSEQIDLSLFPGIPKDLKISLNVLGKYTISSIPLIHTNGENLEISGFSKERTELEIATYLNVMACKSVKVENIKITCKTSFNVTQSNLIFSDVSIDGNPKLDFAGSTVSIDYDLFSSSNFDYTGSEAKSISISNIPIAHSIQSANGLYPYVNTQIKSKSFTWNGPSSVSTINYIYNESETSAQSEGEIKFILNGDATIEIFNFTRSQNDFISKMIFDVQAFKVNLLGIDFIPTSLFTKTDNVVIQKRTPAPTQSPTPSPSPTPQVVEIEGDEQEEDGTIVYNGEYIIQQIPNAILMGQNQTNETNLVIRSFTINEGTNVRALNLIIGEVLRMRGDSTLIPLSNGSISFKNTPDSKLIIENTGDKLPWYKMGKLNQVDNLPKKTDIIVHESQISHSKGYQKIPILEVELLTCEEIENRIETSISIVQRINEYSFSTSCSQINTAHLLDDSYITVSTVSIEITPLKKETPKPSNINMITIIVSVVVAVIVIIIIIVVVVRHKKAKKFTSSSSSSSKSSKKSTDKFTSFV